MKISSLLFFCAISLSTLAAYYSIVGLAMIFSSAFWPVVFMAIILEASKLVITSWLYHKWHLANNFIRTLLSSAVVILMLITSLGIFGFLSRAHVDQNLNNTSVQTRIDQIDAQITASNEIVERYLNQLTQLNRSIDIQLNNNRASQALTARRQQTAERDQLQQRLDSERQKLLDLNQQKIQLRQQIKVLESEVGPIRYVAEFFANGQDVDLEKAVRWMIVVLVLVFDPLAVLMLIAANISLARENAPTVENDKSDAFADLEKINGPSDRGPSIGEVVSVDNIPHRWWDGTAWQLINEPKRSPDLGDVITIDGRPIRWWDGTAWKEINTSPVQNEQNDHIVDLLKSTNATLAGLADGLKASAEINASDYIKDLVKSGMDDWLTNTLKDAKSSTDEEPSVDKIDDDPTSVVDQNEHAKDLTDHQSDHQSDRPKPANAPGSIQSWL